MTKTPRRPLDLLVLAALAAAPCAAQEAAVAGTAQAAASEPTAPAAPLFESVDVLEFTLAMDMNRVNKDVRNEEPEYRPATITYLGPAGDSVQVELEVRTRGHFRRDKGNCNFPPLRLNFSEEGTEGTVFAGEDKIKLVRPCQKDKDDYEQFVYEEFLIYRWYNQLTDISFRVRPAMITYADTQGKEDTRTKFSFLIEDDDHMAARHGADVMDIPGANMRDPGAPAVLHPLYDLPDTASAVLQMFHYMVANTDFSLAHLHNTELIGYIEGQAHAVPYDFDWAGIIDAPYCNPNPMLEVRRCRDRVYRGWCYGEGVIRHAAEKFIESKDAFHRLLNEQAGLRDKSRSEMSEFLDDFFEIIETPKEFEKNVLSQCREG